MFTLGTVHWRYFKQIVSLFGKAVQCTYYFLVEMGKIKGLINRRTFYLQQQS